MGTSGHCQRASWTGIPGPSVGEKGRHVLQGCPQAAGATAWHSGQDEDASCKPPTTPNCCQGLETQADHPASPAVYVLAAIPLQAAGIDFTQTRDSKR